MLIGSTNSGKTIVYEVLQHAMTEIRKKVKIIKIFN